MEMSVQLQRPLHCKTVFADRGCLKFKPFTQSLLPLGGASAGYQVISVSLFEFCAVDSEFMIIFKFLLSLCNTIGLSLSESNAYFWVLLSASFLGFERSLVWRKESKTGLVAFCINSSADFSRKRQRKISTARPRSSSRKGFMPRSSIGTSNQKRGQKNTGVKGDSYTPTASEISGDNKKSLDVNIDAEEEGAVIFSQEKKSEVDITDETAGEASELALLNDKFDATEIYQGGENGNISVIEEELLKPQKEENSEIREIENVQDSERKPVDYEKINETIKETIIDTDDKMTGEASQTELAMEENLRKQVEASQLLKLELEANKRKQQEEASRLLKLEMEANRRKQEEEASRKLKLEMEANRHKEDEEASRLKLELEVRIREQEEAAKILLAEMEAISKQEEASRLLNLEMEESLRKQEEASRLLKFELEATIEASRKLKLEMETNIRRQELERIAEENFSQGIKLFVYPSVVKPDQDIEIFFNRRLSTLVNEPDVLIMGAFNDWRWKSFQVRLNKTHIKNDWWSCSLYIPREAYKVDFVFFNGKSVYDNNDGNDFLIPVDGGMDALAFDDFLLEEKRKELENLAQEQAERERQAEEHRKMEEEKAANEADKVKAREETERQREKFQQLIKKAVRSLHNVWRIEPNEFQSKDLVRLYYNKSSSPLSQAKELWIHGGHNNWKGGISFSEQLVPSDSDDGDWWYADDGSNTNVLYCNISWYVLIYDGAVVVVPDQAFVLDWVFADGPPHKAIVYDNNHKQDYHAIVPKGMPDEQYWADEEQLMFRKLQEERRLREEAIRAKAEKTARMRAETKERTLKGFLLSQKHIVYTEPLDVQAGNIATVFYNPANTNLNGKPEVWFRCSFNRWTHRQGPLPPQKMLPAENGTHVKTSVKVPLDAYMMDFVFSEREDGGDFDNKYGMDYHIPVFGGISKEPPMHIVHIAAEMAPIAKVGGLGDVVTSLSRAVQDLNHNVDIILPNYDCLNNNLVKDKQYHKNYFWGGTEIKVYHGKVEGLSVYFLEPQNGHFSVGCVYGRGNDGERFGFFCHAALEFLHQNGFHPDIIHCHDWTSAPVAWLYKDHYTQYGLSKARIVFTIHNLEFGAPLIGKAMANADKATTVSPTYSREVAGHSAIAPHLHKFHGILNGIDPDIWDPYNDKFLPVPYTAENVVEGKRAAKEALQQRLGLKRADLPLVGIITRLTHQKGIHLIKHAIWRTLERGGEVVLLGSAPDPRIQHDFENLANDLHSSHHDRARLCLKYDEPLSHLIYAGSDFILVPSIFEPCGLTQLTAMRYGSIPVVRKTGGLYDTVYDVDHDKDRAQAQGLLPNGFGFDGADAGGVDYALNRAISAWYEGRDWFDSLCKTVMEQDWSWNRPALDYLELYHSARKST
ncbi:starch synthase 3, chloroplastic/amyloplastic [Senna tora]|uniref:starch synthase n=1 Tax=Senna tora TaxID=362788 RepID=A0A834T782_9FABA|nr:starch synthase 3, chloroplastic/amyloplastic [Senna tora]